MSWKQICLLSCAAMALAACEPVVDESGPPPPPEMDAPMESSADNPSVQPQSIPAQLESDNTAGESTSTIDWDAARTDLASRSGDEELTFSTASADGTQPPVPVLLPTGGSVRIASDGSGPRFKQTSDGYYAVYPYEKYDVIVNGTNEVIGARPEGPRDETPKFTATAAGAQVSLSRYGADYLVEFECYQINPATGTCIEEAEAMGVAESLVIRGTR